MGAKPEWRGFAVVGSILIAITFTDFSPAGPWNDATFTSGSLGLIGLILVYLAWFRITFERRGVVPTLDFRLQLEPFDIQKHLAGFWAEPFAGDADHAARDDSIDIRREGSRVDRQNLLSFQHGPVIRLRRLAYFAVAVNDSVQHGERGEPILSVASHLVHLPRQAQVHGLALTWL